MILTGKETDAGGEKHFSMPVFPSLISHKMAVEENTALALG
jgi:hypothetical protein